MRLAFQRLASTHPTAQVVSRRTNTGWDGRDAPTPPRFPQVNRRIRAARGADDSATPSRLHEAVLAQADHQQLVEGAVADPLCACGNRLRRKQLPRTRELRRAQVRADLQGALRSACRSASAARKGLQATWQRHSRRSDHRDAITRRISIAPSGGYSRDHPLPIASLAPGAGRIN